jgi:hypothetical protein
MKYTKTIFTSLWYMNRVESGFRKLAGNAIRSAWAYMIHLSRLIPPMIQSIRT